MKLKRYFADDLHDGNWFSFKDDVYIAKDVDVRDKELIDLLRNGGDRGFVEALKILQGEKVLGD